MKAKLKFVFYIVMVSLMLFSLGPVAVVSAGPIVKTMVLPPLKMVELQEMLQPFVKVEKITYSIIQDQQPKLVLVGEEKAVARIVSLLEKLSERQVAKDLILITASMEEVNLSKGSSTGLKINEIPVSGTWKKTTSTATYQNTTSSTLQIGDSSNPLSSFYLRSSDDNNRLLISGQMATTNGMPGNLSLVEEVPYVVINANGSGAVQFLKAETIIKVKPTLLEYNEEHPENSSVKLEVNLQISVVGSQVNDANPTITTRQVLLTRILPANQQAVAIAALTSDEDLITDIGIPVLNRLPLLKNLFSQKTTIKERTASILRLAVRFVPQEGPLEGEVKSMQQIVERKKSE